MPTITETIDEKFYYPEKATALAQHLGCRWTQIEEEAYSIDRFDAEGGDYWVLTDEEADEAWEESLDSYIDECILPEMPDFAANYFDNEKWKRDARHDGRGHALNHYDGGEDYETVNGTDYYIDRTT